MRKIIFTLIVSMFLFVGVDAEYRIYNNVEDFEKDKGSICESATDGCNTFFIIDGKVMGGTKKYCSNHRPEWSCLKYKENSISTMSVQTTTTSIDTEENRICTMEYAPVCAQVKLQGLLKTFGNSCMAGDNKILFKGECSSKLSESDINFYNSIKTSKLETKYQDKVYIALDKFNSILSKYSDENYIKGYNHTLSLIDGYIYNLISSYPQDVAMSKIDNIKYLMLKLIKFELIINQR